MKTEENDIMEFEYKFPKNVFINDISAIVGSFMMIILVMGIIKIVLKGFFAGFLLIVFSLILLGVWIYIRYYLRHNFLKINKGLVVIDINSIIKSYKVENIDKLVYITYDKLVFGKPSQYVFYMDDGVKYAVESHEKDKNNVRAIEYIKSKYKKEIEVIENKKNYWLELILGILVMVLVVLIKILFM